MGAINLDLDDLEVPDEPSVVFTLDGRDWECKPKEAIPVVFVEALLGSVPMRMDRLFAGILAETVERDGETVDQHAEFAKLLGRPDSPMTLPRWRLLAERLVEEVLNRPTVRSRSSVPGPRRTGGTSKGGSSSRGTRRKRQAS